MNYIKQLQENIKNLEDKNLEQIEEFDNILRYLSSTKFQGVDNNWINANEIYNRILQLKLNLN